MKVYIMTDLEGISGVSSIEYMDRSSCFYEDARRYLMGDVNAAIAGCFDAGATEVVVKDGHGGGANFIMDQLDPRAEHDFTHGAWTGMLDETFDATLIVGQHAMAGTLNGFLDHTMSSRSWWQYSINGKPYGELGMWATIAGHYDVPLIFVCGDEAACAEARELIPNIRTVAVKRGIERNRAHCKPVPKAQQEIRNRVVEAMKNIDKVKPHKIELPATIELIWYRSDMADDCCRGRTDRQRIDARTVRRTTESQADIMI